MSDKLRELMVKQGPCQHSINDVRMKMVMCPKCVEALLAAQPLVVSLLERAVVDAAIACRKADLELYKSHALGTQKASVAARNKLAELTDALLATQPPAEESKNLVQRRCIYCEGYKGTIMCKHCCGTGYEPAQPPVLPEREREPQVGAELREALTAASQVIANVTDEYSWKAQAIGYLVAFSEVQGIICEALAAPAESRSVERRKAAPQTSGPQCKRCGAFTTYKRVETHGLCMKCENE